MFHFFVDDMFEFVPAEPPKKRGSKSDGGRPRKRSKTESRRQMTQLLLSEICSEIKQVTKKLRNGKVDDFNDMEDSIANLQDANDDLAFFKQLKKTVHANIEKFHKLVKDLSEKKPSRKERKKKLLEKTTVLMDISIVSDDLIQHLVQREAASADEETVSAGAHVRRSSRKRSTRPELSTFMWYNVSYNGQKITNKGDHLTALLKKVMKKPQRWFLTGSGETTLSFKQKNGGHKAILRKYVTCEPMPVQAPQSLENGMLIEVTWNNYPEPGESFTGIFRYQEATNADGLVKYVVDPTRDESDISQALLAGDLEGFTEFDENEDEWQFPEYDLLGVDDIVDVYFSYDTRDRVDEEYKSKGWERVKIGEAIKEGNTHAFVATYVNPKREILKTDTARVKKDKQYDNEVVVDVWYRCVRKPDVSEPESEHSEDSDVVVEELSENSDDDETRHLNEEVTYEGVDYTISGIRHGEDGTVYELQNVKEPDEPELEVMEEYLEEELEESEEVSDSEEEWPYEQVVYNWEICTVVNEEGSHILQGASEERYEDVNLDDLDKWCLEKQGEQCLKIIGHKTKTENRGPRGKGVPTKVIYLLLQSKEDSVDPAKVTKSVTQGDFVKKFVDQESLSTYLLEKHLRVEKDDDPVEDLFTKVVEYAVNQLVKIIEDGETIFAKVVQRIAGVTEADDEYEIELTSGDVRTIGVKLLFPVTADTAEEEEQTSEEDENRDVDTDESESDSDSESPDVIEPAYEKGRFVWYQDGIYEIDGIEIVDSQVRYNLRDIDGSIPEDDLERYTPEYEIGRKVFDENFKVCEIAQVGRRTDDEIVEDGTYVLKDGRVVNEDDLNKVTKIFKPELLVKYIGKDEIYKVVSFEQGEYTLENAADPAERCEGVDMYKVDKFERKFVDTEIVQFDAEDGSKKYGKVLSFDRGTATYKLKKQGRRSFRESELETAPDMKFGEGDRVVFTDQNGEEKTIQIKKTGINEIKRVYTFTFEGTKYEIPESELREAELE